MWRLGEPRPDFELVLPAAHSLLDAHGSLVLLHVEDDLGVDRVVIHDTGPGSQGPARPQEVALALDEEAIFDSETDLGTPLTIGWIDGALFVDSDRFAFVDSDRFAFVDGMTREVVVVDIGQGATVASAMTSRGQFSSNRLLDRRLSGHIVVTDQNHGTVSVYDQTLGVVSTSTFDPMSGRPVGMFPDGQVLFRREPAAPVSPSASGLERRYRNQAVYDVRSPDGSSAEVTRAMADEMARVSATAGGRTLAGAVAVIFGHRTPDARLGDCLVLSQTEWNEIKVIDRGGRLVASIPVASSERKVSQADIVARRQYRIRRLDDSGTRRNNMNRLLGVASQRFGRDYTFDGVESQWIMEVPANRIAPSIDKLVVDSDHRVWARLPSPSQDQGELWQLWDPGARGGSASDRTAVVVRLPKGELLADAHRDRVLVRTENNSLRVRRLPIRDRDYSSGVLRPKCTSTSRS